MFLEVEMHLGASEKPGLRVPSFGVLDT
jgi:hypothetical protein